MKQLSFKTCGIAVFAFVIGLNVTAQKQFPYFEHFDVSDGLSSNIIICTLRDSKGYLWIGTNDGLNKFNGRTFATYFHKQQNNFTTTRNFISNIYEDKTGKIWVISNSDVLSFLNTTDKANCFLEPKEIVIENVNYSQKLGLKYFYEDAENNLCIICKNNVLIKFNPKSNTFKKIDFPVAQSDSIESFRFLFVSKKNGAIYFLNNKSGIYYFDSKIKTKKEIHNQFLQRFLESNEIGAIHIQNNKEDKNSNPVLWILSTKGKFVSINIDKNTCSEVFNVPEEKNASYRAIGVDYENKIWISGNDGGAIVYDLKNNRFEKYKQPFQSTYDFQPTELYSFYLDYENKFWIKTRSGIFKLDPELNHFENFTVRDHKHTSKNNINLLCFFKLDSNRLLIGSNHGVFLYNEEKNRIELNKPIRPDIGDHIALMFRSNNQLYANVFGIQHYDDVTGNFSDIICKGDSTTIERFFDSEFHSVLIDTINNETVWWLCSWNNNDLFLYNTVTYEIESIKLFPDSNNIIEGALRGICKDTYGRVWIGSENNGLVCISNRNKRPFNVNRYMSSNRNSISDNRITDLDKDNRGNIWLVTKTGVTKVELKNRTPVFLNYGVLEGLHHQMTYDGLMDNNNNFWISSSAGLEKFNTNTLTFSHYGFRSGILNPQLATGKYKDDDGNFYFSSFHTFFRFNPDFLVPDTNPLKINISNFTIMENDCTQVLNNSKVILQHDENFISFQLEIITMTHAEACRFRYILHGHDELWTEGADRDYVAYSALVPGTYTFEYNACSRDGIWNRTSKKFSFTILPAWYNRWWFYSVIAFAIALAVYTFIMYRIKQIRVQEKLKLQVMVETQEEERKRIGRDLHDDVGAQLSTLKLFLNSLKDKEGEDRKVLHTESMNMLTTSIGDIRNILINLSPRSLDEHGYVVAVEELVNRINKSNLLKFELSIHGFENRLEPKLENALYRITQELINNTLKYAHAQKIILDVVKSENKIVLMYEDDGIGCDLEQAKNGYGLTNISTRAQMFNGSAHFDSSIGNGFRCETSMSC